MDLLVPLIITIALLFNFSNGLNDAANAIATVISTRVLSPRKVVVAFMNFVAAFGLGTAIAKTIGKGIVDPAIIDSAVILGGLVGAAITSVGLTSIKFEALRKIVLFIFFAPIIGLIVSSIFIWTFKGFTPSSINRTFGKLQLVSASFYSLGHGFNDAQNAMGIIAITLF